MQDPTFVKSIIDAGSFALVVIIVLWVLFRASPNVTSSMEKMASTFAASTEAAAKATAAAKEAASADHKNTVEAVTNAFKSTTESLLKEFRESLANREKECRAEREAMLKRADENDDKDRARRHEDANQMQRAIAEQYAAFRVMLEEWRKELMERGGDRRKTKAPAEDS